VHLGSGPDAVGEVVADLRRRDGDWLTEAARRLARATRADHDAFDSD
jgi:hypothetical protein